MQLGFNCSEIENSLRKNPAAFPSQQTWTDFDIEVFQTPYHEFVQMAQFLQPQPQQTWIDLGSAYGRLGIVLGFLYPEVFFKGYELVPERVLEAKRIYKNWGLSNVCLVQQDLAAQDFILPFAHCYFIYDFGTKNAVDKILEQLKRLALQQTITLVGRGRGIRHWLAMEHPWLESISSLPPSEHWSVYRS